MMLVAPAVRVGSVYASGCRPSAARAASSALRTAEEVGSYKPAPMHFPAARGRIGGVPWLHAAQSNFHDIVTTNALGISNAWINRRSQKLLTGGTPTYQYADLKGLADAMT